MQKSPFHPLLSALSLSFLALSPGARGQATATLTTLHTFSVPDSSGNNSDGANVVAGVIQGSDGNFYGTADDGGTSGGGVAYRLTPGGTLTVLHNFSGSDAYGQHPEAGLIQDTNGSLYGVNRDGGANSEGTAFQLLPDGTPTVLFTFGGGTGHGANPEASLFPGSDGNFYGTTYNGGDNGEGTVFQLTPGGALTTLFSFGGGTGNGAGPRGGVTEGKDGAFYGTTVVGGGNGEGTAFRITSTGALTSLFSFGGDTGHGAYPYHALIQGRDGNFYGTTHDGGANGSGTVFQLTSAGVETVLYHFSGSNGDGASPYAGLVQGVDGNFYGTTEGGGAYGYGTVFQITPAGALTYLHSFSNAADGSDPEGTLIQGSDGAFYGTTHGDGKVNGGTVYKLVVSPVPSSFFDGEVALGSGVYYLAFLNGNYFGYYAYLTDAHYIYHFDLGYEYIFDAADGKGGVYLYDFKSGHFFYTSPVFPFPYLYDFSLNSVLYYYPDPSNPGHYNTDGYRFFYVFNTGQIIVQ